MFQLPAEVFSLSNEAVVLARGSKVVYANRHATNILHEDSVGKTVKSVFGPVLANCQASYFTMDVYLYNSHYTACVNRFDHYLVIFLHKPAPAADYIGEKFWQAMRDGLMNLNLSLELWRSRIGELGDPQIKKSVAAMSRSYYKMSRMVANVSYVLDIDSNKLQPVRVVFDISEHCRQLVDTLSMLYPNVGFSIDCPDCSSICADRGMINQAILNLISNALLHARGCTHIKLTLLESKDILILSVSDDGCGIEPDLMHSVFNKYQDAIDLTSTGAGFGLTVVRGIAKLFGGTLMLESRKGSGTTARMSLSRIIPTDYHSSSEDYSTGMQSILEGLADSLPIEAFEEEFMD